MRRWTAAVLFGWGLACSGAAPAHSVEAPRALIVLTATGDAYAVVEGKVCCKQGGAGNDTILWTGNGIASPERSQWEVSTPEGYYSQSAMPLGVELSYLESLPVDSVEGRLVAASGLPIASLHWAPLVGGHGKASPPLEASDWDRSRIAGGQRVGTPAKEDWIASWKEAFPEHALSTVVLAERADLDQDGDSDGLVCYDTSGLDEAEYRCNVIELTGEGPREWSPLVLPAPAHFGIFGLRDGVYVAAIHGTPPEADLEVMRFDGRGFVSQRL